MAIAAIPGSDAATELVHTAAQLRRSMVGVRGRGPGGGSGVIWRADGLIITNAHVARGPQAIVDLWDGRSLPATVVAFDPQRDLAALRVEATDLPAATIGNSDTIRVGELVLAVGNPLGVVGALSAGIVHTIGPADEDDRFGRSWVQADLRLAPGNSGGPMADARGHVIGINTMIAGGLALAVPSNDVEHFLAEQERPHLGVALQPVAISYAAGRGVGLLILEVEANSPAESSGLLIGDVIVGAAGRALARPGDLNVALRDAGTGGALSVDVLRGGRRLTLEVVLTRETARNVEAA